jgi:hypothetical protein
MEQFYFFIEKLLKHTIFFVSILIPSLYFGQRNLNRNNTRFEIFWESSGETNYYTNSMANEMFPFQIENIYPLYLNDKKTWIPFEENVKSTNSKKNSFKKSFYELSSKDTITWNLEHISTKTLTKILNKNELPVIDILTVIPDMNCDTLMKLVFESNIKINGVFIPSTGFYHPWYDVRKDSINYNLFNKQKQLLELILSNPSIKTLYISSPPSNLFCHTYWNIFSDLITKSNIENLYISNSDFLKENNSIFYNLKNIKNLKQLSLNLSFISDTIAYNQIFNCNKLEKLELFIPIPFYGDLLNDEWIKNFTPNFYKLENLQDITIYNYYSGGSYYFDLNELQTNKKLKKVKVVAEQVNINLTEFINIHKEIKYLEIPLNLKKSNQVLSENIDKKNLIEVLNLDVTIENKHDFELYNWTYLNNFKNLKNFQLKIDKIYSIQNQETISANQINKLLVQLLKNKKIVKIVIQMNKYYDDSKFLVNKSILKKILNRNIEFQIY